MNEPLWMPCVRFPLLYLGNIRDYQSGGLLIVCGTWLAAACCNPATLMLASGFRGPMSAEFKSCQTLRRFRRSLQRGKQKTVRRRRPIYFRSGKPRSIGHWVADCQPRAFKSKRHHETVLEKFGLIWLSARTVCCPW